MDWDPKILAFLLSYRVLWAKVLDWQVQVRLPDQVTCPRCKGRGKVDVPDDIGEKTFNCGPCAGTGLVSNSQKRINSNVPLFISLPEGRKLILQFHPETDSVSTRVENVPGELYRCFSLIPTADPEEGWSNVSVVPGAKPDDITIPFDKRVMITGESPSDRISAACLWFDGCDEKKFDPRETKFQLMVSHCSVGTDGAILVVPEDVIMQGTRPRWRPYMQSLMPPMRTFKDSSFLEWGNPVNAIMVAQAEKTGIILATEGARFSLFPRGSKSYGKEPTHYFEFSYAEGEVTCQKLETPLEPQATPS